MGSPEDFKLLADDVLGHDPKRFINIVQYPVRVTPISVINAMRASTLEDILVDEEAIFVSEKFTGNHPVGLTAHDTMLRGLSVYAWESDYDPRHSGWGRQVEIRLWYGRDKAFEAAQCISGYANQSVAHVEFSRYLLSLAYMKGGSYPPGNGYLGHAGVTRVGTPKEVDGFIKTVRFLIERRSDIDKREA